jgi:hypothetical protein
VLLSDEDRATNLLENDPEADSSVVVLVENDAEAPTKDELTFNRLELTGITELLLAVTTEDSATMVVVTDELKFVRAVEADELNPVVVVETEDESDATEELRDSRDADTCKRLELTGMTELLFVVTNVVRATIVEVNEADVAVADVENELEYV